MINSHKLQPRQENKNPFCPKHTKEAMQEFQEHL